MRSKNPGKEVGVAEEGGGGEGHENLHDPLGAGVREEGETRELLGGPATLNAACAQVAPEDGERPDAGGDRSL